MTTRVLVIGSADLLGHRLQRAGFEVTQVTDLLTGGRRALDDEVGVVVLDLIPPDGDGLEVVAAIRGRRPALPVIILSVRADMPARLSAFEAGTSDFLAKPFSFDELLARLRAQMRRSTWT